MHGIDDLNHSAKEKKEPRDEQDQEQNKNLSLTLNEALFINDKLTVILELRSEEPDESTQTHTTFVEPASKGGVGAPLGI